MLNKDVKVEDIIKVISEDIGLTWKFLARNLGFGQTNIDSIEYENRLCLKEQIFRLFHMWKQREGSSASALKLINALEEENLNEILSNLEEKGFIYRHGKMFEYWSASILLYIFSVPYILRDIEFFPPNICFTCSHTII